MAGDRLLLLLLGCLIVGGDSKKRFDGYKLYSLHVTTSEQVDFLFGKLQHEPGIDFWCRNEVMVAPEYQESFQQQLVEKGISWDILCDNVQELIDAEEESQQAALPERIEGEVSFSTYYRYGDIQAYLQRLAKDYPQLVSVDSIGRSFEGRNLSIIKISSGGNGSRPISLIHAAMHAREWISPAMALYIIHQLVENTSNADLLANVDWHIIPVLNPDGYEYTHTDVRFWRKTRSETVSCNASRYDSTTRKNGVDANRNFGFHWGEQGSSKNPCDNTYAGPRPFSEPETGALRDYVIVNAANIKLYLSLHSYSTKILYSWEYTTVPAPNNDYLHSLASKANDAMVAAGGTSYQCGQGSHVLYIASGTSTDWMKGVAGVNLTYTIELQSGGQFGFDPPASAIHGIVSSLWPAVRVFGEHVAEL